MKDSWFYQLNELSKCSHSDLIKIYHNRDVVLILNEALNRLTKENYTWNATSFDEVVKLIDWLAKLKENYSRNLENAIIDSAEAAVDEDLDKAIEIMNFFMNQCESSFYYELANDWMVQLQEMKSNPAS